MLLVLLSSFSCNTVLVYWVPGFHQKNEDVGLGDGHIESTLLEFCGSCKSVGVFCIRVIGS